MPTYDQAILYDAAVPYSQGPVTPGLTVTISVAWTNNPLDALASLTWTDISTYVRSFETHRGRQHELARMEAGTARILLNNRDRRFDPTWAAGPYAPNIVPFKRVRIQANYNGVLYNLFTGYIESYRIMWPSTFDSDVELNCVDALKLVNFKQIAAAGYPAAVLADGATCYNRLGDQPGSTTAADSTGNGHTGAYHNTIPAAGSPPGTLAPCALGQPAGLTVDDQTGVAVDGLSGYVTAGQGATGTGAFTVELWAKSATAGQGATNAPLMQMGNAGVGAALTAVKAGNEWRFTDGATIADITIPTGTADDGKWHHFVFTRDSSGLVYTLYFDGLQVGQVTAAATHTLAGAAPTIATTTGLAQFWAGGVSDFALYPTELAPFQIAKHYQLGSAGFLLQQSGARIHAVLDALGWPAADRAIELGTQQVQAAISNLASTSSLAYSRTVEQSEGGTLFVDGSGRITFFQQTHTATAPYNASRATFGDGGGSELVYEAIAPVLDDLDVWNEIKVARQGGTAITVSDSTSKSQYGPRTYNFGTLLCVDDASALALANTFLNRYKQPATRLTSITVKGIGDPVNLYPQMFGRELLDRITVKRRSSPLTTPVWSQDHLIESIRHKVSMHALSWETTFGLAPVGLL